MLESWGAQAGEPDALVCQLSKGLEVGFVGFLIAGQFVSVAYYPFMWIQLALMVKLNPRIVHVRAPYSDNL